MQALDAPTEAPLLTVPSGLPQLRDFPVLIKPFKHLPIHGRDTGDRVRTESGAQGHPGPNAGLHVPAHSRGTQQADQHRRQATASRRLLRHDHQVSWGGRVYRLAAFKNTIF